jgi:hypothetical protein
MLALTHAACSTFGMTFQSLLFLSCVVQFNCWRKCQQSNFGIEIYFHRVCYITALTAFFDGMLKMEFYRIEVD